MARLFSNKEGNTGVDLNGLDIDRADPKTYFNGLSSRINDDLCHAVTTEFPPNLYEPMRYVLSSRGKRFRPILLIMTCESVGGTIRQAYNASLAIEILHNFTLVHDDIMDNDDLRRGRETVHKKWNESIAILAGDGLIALAYRYLLNSESSRLRDIVRIFSEAIINICEGQSIDKDMEDADDVSLADYLYMIERKTGVLMAISSELGGILGGAGDDRIAALRSFGLELGVAFQIQDDLLDIISEEVVIGKDLGSDLAQGKKTYPILLFMERASAKDVEYVRNTLTKRNAGPAEVTRVQEMLHEYQIVEAARQEVDRRLDRAVESLSRFPDGIDRSHLQFLAEMIRNRKY